MAVWVSDAHAKQQGAPNVVTLEELAFVDASWEGGMEILCLKIISSCRAAQSRWRGLVNATKCESGFCLRWIPKLVAFWFTV